jgi:GNAT superfamily N-acetyltransferase
METRAAVRENRLSDSSKIAVADYLWFIDNSAIWVWEDSGQILGFSAGDPRDGSIWALFVAPDGEGRGIGRALLRRACDGLRAAGHRRAVLGTEPGTRAEGFYLREGWSRIGTRPNGEVAFEKAV